MGEQTSNKQTTVRPGFLILGVLSIIMMVVWLLIIKPKLQMQQGIQPIAMPESTLNLDITKKAIETIPENLSINLSEPQMARDPFLPPLLNTKPKNDVETIVKSDPLLIPDYTKPIKDSSEMAKPVWKGLVGTVSNRVLIIEYKGKTFLLKKGDQIPESKYRVSDIKTDSVIISFPDGNFSLFKK